MQVYKREAKRTNSGTQKTDGVMRVCTVRCSSLEIGVRKMSSKENAISLKKEQSGVVQFLFLLQKTPTECYLMMREAYEDQVMSRRQVFHWHKQSKEDCALSVAVKHLGRPVSISTNVVINTIGTLITDDSLLTQCKIAAHLGIAKSEGTINIEEFVADDTCLLTLGTACSQSSTQCANYGSYPKSDLNITCF